VARADQRAARASVTRAIAGVCVALWLAPALRAPVADAALVSFGSPLRARASLSTDNLDYAGINTPYGSGVVHTAHFGADTALWNVSVRGGRASAPADGQVRSVSLEGCAQPAKGGPPPLTQIHLQTLAPQGGGRVKVELTSQSFELPVCGERGASDATLSSYRPTGLCIDAGDYVGFNDEGGFVEGFYRAGVPYRVIAAAPGSRMDSFLQGGGTGNGALFSPAVRAPAEGFAANVHEELLLRATLATGADAVSYCRHGLGG
jgi:hypothetical protein